MKEEELDIHNYEGRFETYKKQLDELSSKNKQLLLEWDEYCFVKEDLSLPRRCKLMNTMYNVVVQYLKKDLDRATLKDVNEVVKKIKSRGDYSLWTIQSYSAILKKFFRWLKLLRGNEEKSIGRNEYPSICKWIPTTIKKKDKPKVKPQDILTEDEISKMIETSDHPRTKALVFMLYELGARISEIGNLRIKNLTKTDCSYLVDLKGRTGQRTPEIILSVPSVQEWLDVHPLSDKIKKGENPPLWVCIEGNRIGEHMDYGSIRMLIKRLAKRCGIKKRVWNHLFRFSRVTHVLVNDVLREPQAKKYFGWVPSSSQLDTYSQLTLKDANDSYKKSLGLIKDDDKKNGKRFNPKKCEICGKDNSYKDIYCNKCHNPLDMVTAQRDALKRQEEKEKEVKSVREELKDIRKDLEKFFEKRIEEREQYWYEKLKDEMKAKFMEK